MSEETTTTKSGFITSKKEAEKNNKKIDKNSSGKIFLKLIFFRNT